MRFAVAGTRWGQTHLRWLTGCERARVTTLCYRSDEQRAREIAGQWHVPRISADVSAVLASGEVDALAVAVPPDAREDLLTAGLDAGVLVVTDKPLAHDAATAARLAARARSSRGRAVVCFQWRANPALRALRELCAGGELGQIFTVDLEFQHDFMAGDATRWRWRHHRAAGGAGALADLGVHMFDVLRWMVPGDWTVESARAMITAPKRTLPDGERIDCESEDIADVALADAASPRRARVFVSRVCTGHRGIRVAVQGAAATAVVEANPDGGAATLTLSTGPDGRRESRTFPGDAMNPYDRIITETAAGPEAWDMAGFDDGLAAQVLLEEALRQGAATPLVVAPAAHPTPQAGTA